MKCRLLLAIIAGFSCILTSIADPLITFSFKPFSLNPATITLTHTGFTLSDITTILSLEKSFSPLIAGIPVSYGGYLTASDLQGIVSLPRKHEKPLITFLITTRITPILMGGNTVHHLEREEGTPAILYTAERKEDPKTKKFEWDVQKTPLPESPVIKASTIIIFADPDSLVVQTGLFPTVNQPNLNLPDIYVKNEIVVNQRSLYLMNIKHFFGSIAPLIQKKPLLYQKHIGYEKH